MHTLLTMETGASFEVVDITERLRGVVRESGVREGMLNVTSLHTTVAVCVNEHEARLLDDLETFFMELAPPLRPWKHNDLHLRENIPPDEPKNAHAHLIALMLGHGVTLNVADAALVLGRYQSVLMVELDGPRRRNLSVAVLPG